ncbi:heterokaryon incompatibility protein-domain-containing protein [Copromyces sp. CBS 386.78]|nr:heterokaryon incompatibility protein-domain-containing protein [Copromyces sp. CBS 386.78]
MPPTYTTPSGEIHLSKEAFNRLCERCDSMFKSLSEGLARPRQRQTVWPGYDWFWDEVPYGSLHELFNSASKGDCHFCCSCAAEALMSPRAHRIPGQDVRLSRHNYSSLQPVVSQGESLEMEIKPSIHQLVPWSNNALKLQTMYDPFPFPRVRFTVHIVSEDGKRAILMHLHTEAYEIPVVLANTPENHPARFIDVGSEGSLTVHIRLTTGMDFREQRYMTLSHCWGSSVPTRLLLDNYGSRLKGFALAELPRTFQDAILITRRFNVQFLWIDSLCIIQDSPEDWAAESARMRFVYQNTHLNLAAAVSPDPSGGLSCPRYPLSFVPWAVSLSKNITLQNRPLYEKDSFILDTRGWVLQEQMLARRTLIFGKHQFYWECHRGESSECFPDVVNHSDDDAHTHRLSARTRIRTIQTEFSRGELLHDFKRLKVWALLVAEYSERRLTKQSDKLVAISGLAEELSNGWNGITYLAGLWSYCFRQNLLWTCTNVTDSKERNTDVAPSWSWASLSAKCSLPQPSSGTRVDSLANVLEATVTPLTQIHSFGQLSGGTVCLKGPLLRATVRSERERGWLDVVHTSMDEEGANKFGNQPNIPLPSFLFQWDKQETRNLAFGQPMLFYVAPLHVELRNLSLCINGLLLRPALTSPQEDQLFPQLTGGSEEERMSLLRSDPYLNGPLNTKLKDRYSPVLGPRDNHGIGSFLDTFKHGYSSSSRLKRELETHGVEHFLECLDLAAQHNRESQKPDENLQHDEDQAAQKWEETSLCLLPISVPSNLIDFCPPGTGTAAFEVLPPRSFPPTIFRRFINRSSDFLSSFSQKTSSRTQPLSLLNNNNNCTRLAVNGLNSVYKMDANNNDNRNNRNRHRNRERRRRRNLRRAENRAAVENRAPFPGVHDAGHRADLGPMDLGNRAPVVADMRHDEGWGYGGFENRALAEAPPASQDDQVAAYYDYYIRAEGQADIICPLIALAVRQMGPSCLFSVSACPMQAANGPAWVDDHHINSYGDHALARMTVALAVFQWGLRAQIRMTARRSLPAPQPPQQQMPYPAYAPPEARGAAPYGEAGPHHYGYPAPPPAGPYHHAPYQQ